MGVEYTEADAIVIDRDDEKDTEEALSNPVAEDSLLQVDPEPSIEQENMAHAEGRLLDLLTRVREMLAEDLTSRPRPSNFAESIPLDCPVKAIKRHGFHGFVDMRATLWQDELGEDGTVQCRRATAFSVRSIGVQPWGQDGKLLPIELLLLTFIHELAHTVTAPEERLVESVNKAILKLQPQLRAGSLGRFIAVHHSDSFYDNFAELLRAAERLGIYVLPSVANKFAPKSLMRFDSIDPSASVKGLNLGRSPLFANFLGGPVRPLRVVVSEAARVKKKPISLANRTLAELLKEAKQRLNLRKKPTTVTDTSGNRVSDEQLVDMRDDTLLIIS